MYYHRINNGDVSKVFSSVPLKMKDNGIEYDTMMVAGTVGMRISSSGELFHGSEETGLDTLQPETGWWIYEKNEKDE